MHMEWKGLLKYKDKPVLLAQSICTDIYDLISIILYCYRLDHINNKIKALNVNWQKKKRKNGNTLIYLLAMALVIACIKHCQENIHE